ncbi:hypothetical protein L2E82_47275 [Cichorium intybus]|uniref:Uncharacterized protein n=1 Tax=Cichorium intybus TaxID=13427 RepID=A0ACB8YW27_CICIN|nr:hypothetical protein L2E82_47275 [Cichorium intybus]
MIIIHSPVPYMGLGLIALGDESRDHREEYVIEHTELLNIHDSACVTLGEVQKALYIVNLYTIKRKAFLMWILANCGFGWSLNAKAVREISIWMTSILKDDYESVNYAQEIGAENNDRDDDIEVVCAETRLKKKMLKLNK